MDYLETLAASFPGATTFARYLANVDKITAPLGFDRDHTFAAVSLCRDELAQPFLTAVEQRWDQPFNLGGLGALPSLGHTGWKAVLSHVPYEVRRGNLIVFGMTHIGIDPDGVLGQTLRRHQTKETTTCGAMVALLESLGTDPEPVPEGLDDREADRLHAVMSELEPNLPNDLLELTKLGTRAVDKEMWTELDALQAHLDMDVAVFCGIQVHLPDDVDHIFPLASAIQGIDGVRREIEIGTP